jgi:hypothetical protein
VSGLITEAKTWAWEASTDRAQIQRSDAGLFLRGQHEETQYQLFAGPDWATQWVKVTQMAGTEQVAALHLTRHPGGWRHADGPEIADSAAAIDPDIGCTAATNTLPIRRLNLAVGEIAELDILYIPVPALVPSIARQRYSRHRGGYSYENLTSGFSARIEVDSAGWVTHYPGVCKRIG